MGSRRGSASVRTACAAALLGLALSAPARAAPPVADRELIGLDDGAALVAAGRHLDAVSPNGAPGPLASLPAHGGLSDFLAGDEQALVVDRLHSEASDPSTFAGTQTLSVATPGGLGSPTRVGDCGVEIPDGATSPVPPVALDGPRVAITERCPYDELAAGGHAPDDTVDLFDLSAGSPSPLRLTAGAPPLGLALAGAQLAIRTTTAVSVLDTGAGQPVRTVVLPGTQAGRDDPTALGADGTVFTASPVADRAGSAWGAVCGSAGPLVAFAPGAPAATPVAAATCAAPVTATAAGLLFVQRGAPGVGELMLLPPGAATANPLVSFRDPIAGAAAAAGVLGGRGDLGDLGSGRRGFDLPASLGFEYAADDTTLAYRLPGCTAPASLHVGPPTAQPTASTATCTAVPSAVRVARGRAQLRVRCPEGCDGAWNASTGRTSPAAARPLVVAAGGSVTLRAGAGCRRAGATRRVRFVLATTNGTRPVARSARIRC